MSSTSRFSALVAFSLRGRLTNTPLPSHRCAALGSYLSGLRFGSAETSIIGIQRQYSKQSGRDYTADPKKWKDNEAREEFRRRERLGVSPRSDHPTILSTESISELARLLRKQEDFWGLDQYTIAMTQTSRLMSKCIAYTRMINGSLLVRRRLGFRIPPPESRPSTLPSSFSSSSSSVGEFLDTPVASGSYSFPPGPSSSASSPSPSQSSGHSLIGSSFEFNPSASDKAPSAAAFLTSGAEAPTPYPTDPEERRRFFELMDSQMDSLVATNPGLLLRRSSIAATHDDKVRFRIMELDRIACVFSILFSRFCSRHIEASDQQLEYALQTMANMKYLLPPLYNVISSFAAQNCERVASTTPSLLIPLLRIVTYLPGQISMGNPTAKAMQSFVAPLEASVIRRLHSNNETLSTNLLCSTSNALIHFLIDASQYPRELEVVDVAQDALAACLERLVQFRFAKLSGGDIDAFVAALKAGVKAGVVDERTLDDEFFGGLKEGLIEEARVRTMKDYQVARLQKFLTSMKEEHGINIPEDLVTFVEIQSQFHKGEAQSAIAEAAK